MVHEDLLLKIQELESKLAEYEQLIDAIKSGEVDAFAVRKNNQSEIFTLQSGDYAYRMLVENFNEGALNLTDQGLIVYTNNYFHTLLNLPYEKVIGHSVVDFIHPDSIDQFRELFRKGLAGKVKGEIQLYNRRSTVPVYVSLTSLYPTLPCVGVIITDLTEKKRYERRLEEKNKQLEEKNMALAQSNAELASFSFIASHDLQEPLRKIQTFSNRILDKINGNVSPDIMDYLSRITVASGRMKSLISDLLNYSRLGSGGEVAGLTDLNVIVTEAMNNLEQGIDQSKVVFEIDQLPSLRVIPHQFVQLFTNLFSNSIKYRKPGTSPVIRLSHEIVDRSQLPRSDVYLSGKYHRITITDNGIGFDPVHADKIFEMFQRLHSKSEFEGTGIGLAICKRVVQNHRGFIHATGMPSGGATFTLYFPH